MSKGPFLHVGDRARKLLQHIDEKGFEPVARQDKLENVDRDLLYLLSRFRRKLKGGEKAPGRLRMNRRPTPESEADRYAILPAPSAAPTQSQDDRVD